MPRDLKKILQRWEWQKIIWNSETVEFWLRSTLRKTLKRDGSRVVNALNSIVAMCNINSGQREFTKSLHLAMPQHDPSSTWRLIRAPHVGHRHKPWWWNRLSTRWYLPSSTLHAIYSHYRSRFSGLHTCVGCPASTRTDGELSPNAYLWAEYQCTFNELSLMIWTFIILTFHYLSSPHQL